MNGIVDYEITPEKKNLKLSFFIVLTLDFVGCSPTK